MMFMPFAAGCEWRGLTSHRSGRSPRDVYCLRPHPGPSLRAASGCDADQHVTGGAVKAGEADLAPRPAASERVEGEVQHFPCEVDTRDDGDQPDNPGIGLVSPPPADNIGYLEQLSADS